MIVVHICLEGGNAIRLPIENGDVPKVEEELLAGRGKASWIDFPGHFHVNGKSILGWYYFDDHNVQVRLAEAFEKSIEAIEESKKDRPSGDEWKGDQ